MTRYEKDNIGDNDKDNDKAMLVTVRDSKWLIVTWTTKPEETRQDRRRTRPEESHCGSRDRLNYPIACIRAPRRTIRTLHHMRDLCEPLFINQSNQSQRLVLIGVFGVGFCPKVINLRICWMSK